MSQEVIDEIASKLLARIRGPNPEVAPCPDVTLTAAHYAGLVNNLHELELALASAKLAAVMQQEGPDWLRTRLELIGLLKFGSHEYGGPFDDPDEILRAVHHYATTFFGQALSPQPNEAAFLAKRFPSEGATAEMPPAINEHQLYTGSGRLAFLTALANQGASALLMAVNHVWLSLAEPRSVRCCLMAQRLSLHGSGKLALRRVLTRFLEDLVNADAAVVIAKYEMIIDGRRDRRCAKVLKGPWGFAPRAARQHERGGQIFAVIAVPNHARNPR